MTTQPVAADPATTEWADKDFTERVRVATNAYVLQGLNYPAAAYVFHALKLVLLVAGWMWWVRFTPGLGTLSGFTTWVLEPIAFQKAFLWGCMFEVMGLGCMSGPLGLKVWPPFTAGVHFLWPGTVKLPCFPDLPYLGGTRRTLLDVALYALLLASFVNALVRPEIGASHLVPIVVLRLFRSYPDDLTPSLLAKAMAHAGTFLEFAAPLTLLFVPQAQPILGSTLHWRIVDGKRGKLAEGHAALSDLARRKPWDVGVA